MTSPGTLPEGPAAFNGMPVDQARRALLDCCECAAWASALLEGRPYQDLSTVLARADAALAAVSRDEIEAAVAAHPRIGEPPKGGSVQARWSRGEQAAFVAGRSEPGGPLAEELRAYEKTFGRIFLVDAQGLDAEAIAARLRSRLGNSPQDELLQVRSELGGIVRRRLIRILT